MSLNRKIDVEPLTDARMSKIKKAIFERLDEEEFSERGNISPERRHVSGFAGAWSSFQRRTPRWVRIAPVVIAVGAAAVIALIASSRTVPVLHPALADNPSRIVTGPSASHLALGDSSIDVSPNSVLLVNGDDDRGVLLVLERGSVTCDVAPRHGRPPMIVQAGDVRVRVVGTHFTVTRVDDSARVAVARGTVEVSADGHTSLVHEGEVLAAPERANAIPPSVVARALDLVGQAPTVAVDLPMAGGPLHLRARAPQQSPSPLRSLLPTDETDPAVKATPRLASEAPSASARSTQDATVQSDLADQELFEQASEIEKHDPSRAIATYRRVAAGSGRWAMNALFAQGRLEVDRGDMVEGSSLLGSYLTRYPRGPNAADARLLLDRMK